ncbi:MAG TPA: ABC transporter permease [Chloroflexota bacterium]|nr:ABC transporter permease [Chloroflexota bacterium]
MGRFVARRLIQSAVLLFVVMTASFFLIHAAPGGPETALFSDPRVNPEALNRMRERFGLNDPLPVQYGKWLMNMIVLDFGRSYSYQLPVVNVIGQRIGPTLQLGLVSYAIGILGVPLGIYAAARRGSVGDNTVRIFTVLGTCVPTWWLGLTVIVFLNSAIGWFPNGQGSGGFLDWLSHIILPAFLLGLGGIVTFSRFMRSEVLEVLGQDYIRTARAKGLPGERINRNHLLRNALLPVVTLLGYLLPSVLSGAIITEYIFNWPGMGKLYFEAASSRDYPLLLGMLMLGTSLTIIGTLLADLGYGLVDPRIRYD